MALDYIIGGLQLVSAAVNVLALGAFWISPGLRATANRFVINLLVANIVACLALTPALWLHGGLKTSFHMDNSIESQTERILKTAADLNIQAELPISFDDKLSNSMEKTTTTTTVKPLHHTHHHNHQHHKFERDLDETEIDTFASLHKNSIKESIESLYIQDDGHGNIEKISEKRVVDSRHGDENDEIEIELEEIAMSDQQIAAKPIETFEKKSSIAHHRTRTVVFSENALIFDCTRFAGFDFAAAVGVLSVLLVVSDTTIAVTDPLRYHSRISYLKSWLLIASVWVVSIIITIVSAFRAKWCHIDLNLDNESFVKEIAYTNTSTVITTTATFIGSSDTLFVANIYAFIFSCVFFILIILVPIIMVCVMYYKIFSEARQSGLRMRRNGSSPLLQSSLNLNNSSLNAVVLNENQRYPSIFDVSTPDALTMKIDAQQYAIEDCKKTTSIATHHQYRRYLDIPESETQQQQTEQSIFKRQRTKSEKNLNGLKPKLSQIQRHFSARQLEKACQDVPAFLTKNHNLSRMLSGEMRQVHSSPNLQKLSNLDLLHKVPYCLNNTRSTCNINQTSQQSSNSTRALSYMVSIRHRLSNASSIFKYREEGRAARVGIIVVLMLLISYLPYGLLTLLQGRLTFIPNASIYSILFLLIANITSPFVFAYRNRRVRRGICRLFGVNTKSNNYLQKQRMQLRNGQINNNANKHVRIHRNLSASNFSLNMLPYKFAAVNSMLPIQHEQVHGTVIIPSGHGSVLVPIDDVEIESHDNISRENSQYDLEQKKIDENNNKLNKATEEIARTQKERKSLLQRICSNNLRKTSVSDMANESEKNQSNIETKGDDI